MLLRTLRNPSIVDVEDNAEKCCGNCFYCAINHVIEGKDHYRTYKCVFYAHNPRIKDNNMCPAWVTLINWSEL